MDGGARDADPKERKVTPTRTKTNDESEVPDEGQSPDESQRDDCSDACSSQETCCQGTCVNLEGSLEHCGRCGNSCGSDNSDTQCHHGECVLSCTAGFVDCDGLAENGCELKRDDSLSAPRLLHPALGAFSGSLHSADRSGSLRPHLTWRSAAGLGCGAMHHEVQVDDSCSPSAFQDCAFESPEVHTTTTKSELTLALDLPVSNTVPVGTRYYWRVRSCEAQSSCSKWSEVRYLDVGRDIQDVTGDGYPDLIVQGQDRHYALLLGERDFGHSEDGAPDALVEDRHFEKRGSYNPAIRFLGDVDGDGFNDFVADGSEPEPRKGGGDDPAGPPPYRDFARLLFFGAANASDIEAVDFVVPRWGAGLGNNGRAGDFNGDGYADWVSAQSIAYQAFEDPDKEEIPAAYLFWGGPLVRTSFDLGPRILSPSGIQSDYFAAGFDSGDFNGDGLPDLVLLDRHQHSAVIILGAKVVDVTPDAIVALGSSLPPEETSDPIENTCLGGRIAVADMNGDGFDDFALACSSPNTVQLYLGGSTLADEMAATWLPPASFNPAEDVAIDVAFGDLNNDGYPDLLTSWGTIVAGGKTIGEPATHLPWIGRTNYLGMADVDADGLVDLVIAPNASSNGFWARGDGTFGLLDDPYQTTSILRILDTPIGSGVGR